MKLKSSTHGVRQATPKVFIASPISKTKPYTDAVLSKIAFDVKAYMDDSPSEWTVVQRIANIREVIRKDFLTSDCTHLYFHDADMMPPADIVERLLALDTDIASGVYLVRGVTEAVAPIMLNLAQGRMGVHLSQSGVFTGGDVQEVLGVGMGCMLIRREVLEKVGFREPEHYTADVLSEDYQFCIDAVAAGFSSPKVDLSLACWHVDSDGKATLPVIGEEVYSAAYIGDSGHVGNRYGYWETGVPKPISQEDAENLNYEFWHGWARSVQVVREVKL